MESVSRWRAPAAAFLVSQCITPLLGSAAVQMAIAWYAAVETRRALGGGDARGGVRPSDGDIAVRGRADRWHGSRKAAVIVADAVSAVAAAVLAVLVTTVSAARSFCGACRRSGGCARHARACRCRVVQPVMPLLVSETALMRYNGIASTVQGIVNSPPRRLLRSCSRSAAWRPSWLSMCLRRPLRYACFACAVSIPDHAPAHAGTEREDSASAATRLFADAGAGLREIRARRDVAFARRVRRIRASPQRAFGVFRPAFDGAGVRSLLYRARRRRSARGALRWRQAGGALRMREQGGKGRVAGGACHVRRGKHRHRVGDGYPAFLMSLAVLSAAILLVQAAVVARLQACVDSDMTGRVFGLMGPMYAGFVPLASVVVSGPAPISRPQDASCAWRRDVVRQLSRARMRSGMRKAPICGIHRRRCLKLPPSAGHSDVFE